MNVLGELHAVAAKLSPYDDRPTCECCGQGKLDLIDERPDPVFAVLGMTCQMLKCDFLECGKLTIIWRATPAVDQVGLRWPYGHQLVT